MRALWRAYFLYGENPTQAMQELVRRRRFEAALLGYAAAALCWVSFFWLGDHLTAAGFLWRFVFFWLLEVSVGYLWAALSGLFLNFFSDSNGPSALFITFGISGFVQSLILCFALIAAAAPTLASLATLACIVTLLLRFSFAVLNTARAVEVPLNKALGALCFVLVPVAAAICLAIGTVALLISLIA